MVPNFGILILRKQGYKKLGCYRPSPLKKNLVLEIRRLRAEKERKLAFEIVFTLPGCLFLGMIAPLNFVELDLAPSSNSDIFFKIRRGLSR